MLHAASRRARPALVGALALLALAAAACADHVPPPLAPGPPHRIGACGGPSTPCPATPPCDGPQCDCAADGRDSSCDGVIVPLNPDSSTPSLRIVVATGPNPQRSFTTRSGERTLALAAQVRPAALAGQTTWTVVDDPTDVVASAAPTTAPTPGPSSAVDVPAQSTDRWHQPHGTAWTKKALAFKVTAEASAFGLPPLRDSAVVRQREADVLRQEYLDFDIPVPAASDLKTAADVAGLTRFSWPQLNQGDYSTAVLTSTVLAKLNEIDVVTGYAMRLTSVFRNPAHQRFHIDVSGGGPPAPHSQHQYGTAFDVATFRNLVTWNRFQKAAKAAGACTEPLKISTLNHVHADWRAGAPACPAGW